MCCCRCNNCDRDSADRVAYLQSVPQQQPPQQQVTLSALVGQQPNTAQCAQPQDHHHRHLMTAGECSISSPEKKKTAAASGTGRTSVGAAECARVCGEQGWPLQQQQQQQIIREPPKQLVIHINRCQCVQQKHPHLKQLPRCRYRRCCTKPDSCQCVTYRLPTQLPLLLSLQHKPCAGNCTGFCPHVCAACR